MRHLTTLFDVSDQEFQTILDYGMQLKEAMHVGHRPPLLAGRNLALLFEKPSLRTRLSFEAGMAQLGGATLFLSSDVGWKSREPIGDFVRVLGEYYDAVVCRTFSHATIEELAGYNSLSVVNGLSDLTHPCQALADMMTIRECAAKKKENLSEQQVVFVGDGNNVARSLAHACAVSGIPFRLVGPSKYHFDETWLNSLRERFPQMHINQTDQLADGLDNASVIYTDVWTSMGQEAESEKRRAEFADYQVNRALLAFANRNANVMHCLPAHRGEEITAEVLEMDASVVIQQAGNRMHAQKGLLVWLAIQGGWIDESDVPQ